MANKTQKNLQDDASTDIERDIITSEKKFRASLGERERIASEIRGVRSEEECALDPTCREAELKVELYKAEHDNAGAFKFKRFSRETSELVRSEKIKFDEETGQYSLSPELKERKYLIVSVGELARLNKQGHSQEAGDAGLRAVIKACDEVSAKLLGPERAAKKNIFRYNGDSYCVEFDDVSTDDLSAIENSLKVARLDIGEAYKNIEVPPPATYKLSLGDALNNFNDTKSPDDESDPYADGYKLVSRIRRLIDRNLETKIFATKVMRAIDKLRTAKTRIEAEDFFNEYLAKSFLGTGLEKLEDIEALADRHIDPDALRHEIEWRADDAAKNKFAAEEKAEEREDHLVDARRHELIRDGVSRMEAEHMESDFDTGNKIAVIPPLTRGLAALARANFNKIKAQGTEWAEAKRLEYEIERAKRDEGTGLLERGQFYEDWNAQIEYAEATGVNASVIFVDMGFLKYFNDAGGRRVGDAALRKAAELMEEAIDRAGAKGAVYRYGGDEFAIRVEGDRMEAKKVTAALEELRSQAGRIPDLEGLAEQGLGKGLGKGLGRSRADYSPTELVFNTGIAETGDFVGIINDLRDAGELVDLLSSRSLTENEFKAVLMVKLADTSVNYEKALSRFHLLLKFMSKNEYRDQKSQYRDRVDSIIKFSQKAILGSLGGEAALRIFADELLAADPVQAGRDAEFKVPPQLNEQIERFIADRLERAKEIEKGEKHLVDKMVELQVSQKRLDEQVLALGLKLIKKEQVLLHERERVKELQAKYDEAKEAYDVLIKTRENIEKSAVRKGA